LLTDTERILFRRLAVFLGGFDLDAAQAVAGPGDIERYQVLDQLTLLVDKSLVVAENTGGRTRYRLLETIRQYALEKLGESGEADAVRSRHRDHYASMAAMLDAPARSDYEQRVEQAEVEMDNLRSAFGWSLENAEIERALELASSLQPLWHARGRIREGRAWFDAAFTDNRGSPEVAAAVRARALADKAMLDVWVDGAASLDQAQRALAAAREVDDPAVVTRALTACGHIAGFSGDAQVAGTYFAEAAGLARTLDDRWRLCQILAFQAGAAAQAGFPGAARAAAEEGRDLADAIGDRFGSRECRVSLGWAQLMEGDVVGAVAQFGEVVAEAEAAHEVFLKSASLNGLGVALVHHGQVSQAHAAADAAFEAAKDLGEYFFGLGYIVLALAALAAGDGEVAQNAGEAAWRHMSFLPWSAAVLRPLNAEVALAGGDLVGARRWADEAIPTATGWPLARALMTRARAAIAEGEPVEAEGDAHDALACAVTSGVYIPVPDALECLADLARDVDDHQAARLFSAAEASRQRTGMVRFKIYDAGYETSVAELRDAMGEEEFEAAWAEGAALPTEEAIAYAQRGRGARKRPTSGWASLTPAERDVVRLVGEGLANKDIAARLFVSPRTVQTHLTHVYTKLGVTSRVQLVQEAARHT
jgi:DNA-binding CsgD family transcriptional regulator/tetratricopeptide (TPR) repeat protein